MSICFTNPRHSAQVFAMFLEMRELEELWDIKLETSVDHILAHKVVLAACSPYFREEFKNWDNEEESFVISEEHNSDVVSAIINYFYTGRLEIEAVLLPDLIETAMFFQASDILERCESHVIRQLSTDNCLKFYHQAMKFGLKDLQGSITRFINWHFLELTKQEAFLELSAEDICKFAGSDILNIEQEEDVYEALWKWFKHEKKNRKIHCEQVFSKVRFFQLHPEFVTERVIPELAKGEGVCKDEIKTAIIFQSSDKKKRKQELDKLTPRSPSQLIYMFDNKSPVVEKYDPITVDCVKEKRLVNTKELSKDQTILKAAVVVQNELYVVSSEKIEKFNNMTLSWEKVGKGENILGSCLCVDKDCFYVIGGRDQGAEEKRGFSVKCFNVLSLSWSQLPDMTYSRQLAACVANNGRIYVMGGFVAKEPLKSVSRFSSRSNKWKKLVPLNIARFHFNAIVIRNIIYAIGGRNNESQLNSIEMFDLDSQEEKWCIFEQSMNRPRSEFGTAYYNGQIWCLGGRGENSIEKFDFKTKTWEMVGKLGEIRHGMSCVTYPIF